MPRADEVDPRAMAEALRQRVRAFDGSATAAQVATYGHAEANLDESAATMLVQLARDLAAARSEAEGLRKQLALLAPVLLVPAELVELAAKATQGEAFAGDLPWIREADVLLIGSPDPNAGHMIADFGMTGHRDDVRSDDGSCGLAEGSDDTRFAAAAWNFAMAAVCRAAGAEP